MSEYNADIRNDNEEEFYGESIRGDEQEDLFDDLNTPDDSEVKKRNKVTSSQWISLH